MSDWQPIETAPRDGTQILAFAQGSHGPSDVFYGVAEWAVDGPGKIQPHVEDWFWNFAIRPTHWQPLPAPPQPSESNARIIASPSTSPPSPPMAQDTKQ